VERHCQKYKGVDMKGLLCLNK